jgi:hypothetical protein
MVIPRSIVPRGLFAAGVLLLCSAAASPAEAHPGAPPFTWLRSGWGDFHFEDLRLFVEGSAGPVAGVGSGDGRFSAGYAARLRVLEPAPYLVSSGFPSIVSELLLGDGWGLEVSFRAFDAGRAPSRLFVGLALTRLNLIGERTEESRLRGPTLLGIALPEVGFWFPMGGFAASYISYSAPFSYLLSEHVAVELRPSLTFTFQPDRGPGEAQGWLAASVLWR